MCYLCNTCSCKLKIETYYHMKDFHHMWFLNEKGQIVYETQMFNESQNMSKWTNDFKAI
jgi:hypothetical protein